MRDKTTYVTCMYNHLHETIYGGRNRFNMYVESMRSLSKLGANIVCFTSQDEVNELSTAFRNNGINTVTLKTFDLFSQDYNDFIMRMKTERPEVYVHDFFWQNRSPHVMWGKTKMLMREMEYGEGCDNIFWIDAGLSSSSIIRHCYFPNLNKAQYYYSEGLFNRMFTTGLVRAAKGKIFSIIHTHPNNRPIPQHYNKTDYGMKSWAMIGGLFGGNVNIMRDFCLEFDTYIPAMESRNEMYSEESIYTGINNDNKEWFENYYFDTFYHENWEGMYIKSERTFSSVLEGLL